MTHRPARNVSGDDGESDNLIHDRGASRQKMQLLL